MSVPEFQMPLSKCQKNSHKMLLNQHLCDPDNNLTKLKQIQVIDSVCVFDSL